MRIAMVMVLVLVGCGVDYEHTTRRGRLCAIEDPYVSYQGPVTLEVGKSVTLHYWGYPGVGGCVFDAHCAIQLGASEHELVVNAYLGWNEQPINCPRTIPNTGTLCQTPTLFAGLYTVLWDDQRILLRVPSTMAEPPCVEQ